MNLEEKKEFIIKKLDDLKVLDIKSLDLKGKSSMTDCIIIGSGTSEKHLSSSIEHLKLDLKKELNVPFREEKSDGWVLLDLYDIIIHLFTEEKRNIYRLEEIWK